MKKKIESRKTPITEKLRLLSIVEFYISAGVIALSVVVFPVLLVIAIFAGFQMILFGIYAILISVAIAIGIQIIVLLQDSLAIILLKHEKDTPQEDLYRFNNSFALPENLEKKMAKGKQKAEENRTAQAAQKASADKAAADKAAREQASAAVTPPPSKPVVPPSNPANSAVIVPTEPETPKAPVSEPDSSGPWTCHCGAVNDASAKFCKTCGSPKPETFSF